MSKSFCLTLDTIFHHMSPFQTVKNPFLGGGHKHTYKHTVLQTINSTHKEAGWVKILRFSFAAHEALRQGWKELQETWIYLDYCWEDVGEGNEDKIIQGSWIGHLHGQGWQYLAQVVGPSSCKSLSHSLLITDSVVLLTIVNYLEYTHVLLSGELMIVFRNG